MSEILKNYYEASLAEHGPTAKGMAWPNEEDLQTRFNVMSDLWKDDITPERATTILDVGCGVGLYRDYLEGSEVAYVGIDISEKMIAEALKKYPKEKFLTYNILRNPPEKNSFDYVIMNGVLTVKHTMTQKQMITFAKQMIRVAFRTARKGIAFNVMNKFGTSQRDDLFYWPFNKIATVLANGLSKHYTFRADYGLYDYTVYVYKEPQI